MDSFSLLLGLGLGTIATAIVCMQFYTSRAPADFEESVLFNELVKRRRERNIAYATRRSTENDIAMAAGE
jgi:hypothetical protein